MREHLPDRIYANEAGAKQAEVSRRLNITLRQNIDEQISAAEARVVELKEVKTRLEASGLLDTRIEDLSQAMRW